MFCDLLLTICIRSVSPVADGEGGLKYEMAREGTGHAEKVKAFLACADVASLNAETDSLVFAPKRSRAGGRQPHAQQGSPAPAPTSSATPDKPQAG